MKREKWWVGDVGHQLVLEIVTSIAFRVCVSFFGMWKPTKCKVIRLSWKPGINRNPGFFRIQVFVPKFGISKLQRSNQGWPGNWLTWIFWTWTQNLHRVHSLDLKFQVTKAFEVPIGIIIGTDFFSSGAQNAMKHFWENQKPFQDQPRRSLVVSPRFGQPLGRNASRGLATVKF